MDVGSCTGSYLPMMEGVLRMRSDVEDLSAMERSLAGSLILGVQIWAVASKPGTGTGEPA